ncbi:MAG: DUF1638 domain-containing protein [Burkholderiaceae bacterium]|nr:MAG: DUF1638 domain-containing protein [Burkholderiaceae bacterium]MCC7286507.1 DUF1638 domain-containing protein [Burkholderiaceae bacterium]
MSQPTIVLSCNVLRNLLGQRLPPGMPVTWMDIALHNTPKKLAAALQQQLDALPEPSTVIVGYGLCGSGLVGLKAGVHTLIIPRTHDCVAIFIGSQQRFVQRFVANAGTYYLTKGWLDAKDEPLTEYRDYVEQFDEETADYLVEMKYRHYRVLCMVGFSQEELDGCRTDAMKVAEFCKQRFGMEYEEIVGTSELIEALLAMPNRLDSGGEEFVVVRPGGEIALEMFLRAGEGVPQGRKEA